MIKDFYDESKPVIGLEPFYGPKKHLVDKCIVVFSKRIHGQILEHYKCSAIGEIMACNGSNTIWLLDYQGEKIAFYLSFIGSSMAGSGIIEANNLIGATKFIMFGSCGCLDPNANGKFIIPTESYRGEGMSHYFIPASDYIKISNHHIVSEIFAEMQIPFVKGKCWTVECMLRETENLVKQRKEEGCIAVEMELAGVQAVCEYYHFELYDFLASGDVVIPDNYQLKDLADANHDYNNFLIALELAKRI